MGATMARKTPAERSAALHREIARRRAGSPMTTGDVKALVESVVDELELQGMPRRNAAGLVIRMANESAVDL